jgi:hypothetical protein
MADLSPTQAIHGGAGVVIVDGVCGEALTAKDAVYKSSADSKWYQVDVDSAPDVAAMLSDRAGVVGICMFGGSTNATVPIAIRGPIDMGTVFTAGVAYYASDTAGKIRPAADNGSGDSLVFLGTARTTSVIYLYPVYHGAALA